MNQNNEGSILGTIISLMLVLVVIPIAILKFFKMLDELLS